ncbi:MAG: helix-hairpin-helix domain-containing protein [Sphingomonadales bacterium]|nr:MAG: helix-hairpin-helix domain-containing protein [Sphingomonadales bacterium]
MSHLPGLVAIFALGLAPLSTASSAPININTADAATLARDLKGIGLKRAQAIVDYRSKNGPFRSADELALVKGIGKRAIDANRADIRTDAVKAVTKPAAATSPSR